MHLVRPPIAEKTQSDRLCKLNAGIGDGAKGPTNSILCEDLESSQIM